MRLHALGGRRLVVGLMVGMGVVLMVSLAMAQSGPGDKAKDTKHERVAAKVEELATRIGDWVEAKREVERADSALVLYEDAAAGGKALGSIVPNLANDKHQLEMIEVERDIMLDGGGTQNPRYLAMAKRVDQMKSAYAKQLEVGKAKVAGHLDELRLEATAAKTRLDEAGKRVETVKRELVELASGA